MVRRGFIVMLITLSLFFSCVAESKNKTLYDSFVNEMRFASNYVKDTPFADNFLFSLNEMNNISFDDLEKTENDNRLYNKDDIELYFSFFKFAVFMKASGRYPVKVCFSFTYKDKFLYTAYLTEDKNIKLIIDFYDEDHQRYIKYMFDEKKGKLILVTPDR